MKDLKVPSIEYCLSLCDSITDSIDRMSPSRFTEEHRYLPSSVTSSPGPMSFDVFPYWREIVDCGDVHSEVREINILKGVQIAATTSGESVIFYYLGHVQTLPILYMTADKELATGRLDNNILPMLTVSGFENIIKSSDENNKRRTGKRRNLLQVGSKCYIIFEGAKNANKQRQYSFCIIVKDELDAWPLRVGRDGDPDKLTDDRAKGYEQQRKIFRMSTPLENPSRIYKQYMRGDQRKWKVRCLKCNYLQELRWTGTNSRGEEYGLNWRLDGDGNVIEDSVRYLCEECQHPHTEHDKVKLFSIEQGALWVPTARPVSPDIRSYYLPGYYSPYGKGSWYSQAVQFNEAWNVEQGKPRDLGKMQVFYNNVLAKPWTPYGTKVSITQASGHRRLGYRFGQIPNDHAVRYAGSRILFLTVTVDVHKHFLAVAVWGWCREARSYLIDYFNWEDDSEQGCESPDSEVWKKLSGLIETQVYETNEYEYRIVLTLIDSGYATSVVYDFCAQYASGVVPIKGVPNVARARDKEFWPFKTQTGQMGVNVSVDYYKNRLAPVLRREWGEHAGQQDRYHFNAPADVSDASLKELTVENRREEVNEKGETRMVWYRPNARNELWDLLVYGHASVDMLAWDMCCTQMGLEVVDMDAFWESFDI